MTERNIVIPKAREITADLRITAGLPAVTLPPPKKQEKSEGPKEGRSLEKREKYWRVESRKDGSYLTLALILPPPRGGWRLGTG